MRARLFAILLLPFIPGSAGGAPRPHMVISLQNATLRLERGKEGSRQVFPVSVGRLSAGKETTPLGTIHTGPNPRDRELYIPSRKLPAFHRGLPNLRLDLRGEKKVQRRPSFPFGLHGPVTPTLIWGRASRGCVRMSARGIRALYKFAAKHPAMPVTIIPGPDQLPGGGVASPDTVAPGSEDCPEASVGARRLTRLKAGKHQDRSCGGVDHWYALELSGGDRLELKLAHGGGLSLELYGIRGISAVARGKRGISYKVPLARNNRGDRFVRVVARNKGAGVVPYSLEVSVGGTGASR